MGHKDLPAKTVQMAQMVHKDLPAKTVHKVRLEPIRRLLGYKVLRALLALLQSSPVRWARPVHPEHHQSFPIPKVPKERRVMGPLGAPL
jgi:hypothetical protein